MTPALVVWLEFALCAALITLAGARLSRYGEVIARKTSLGDGGVGLVLLASVTSLPELVTGVASVTLADAPDIAVGNVLGACIFNLLLIVVLDFLHRSESVYTRARQSHVISAAFGLILLGVVASNLVIAATGPPFAFGHVGVYTPIIVALYFLALRTVAGYERREARVGSEVVARQAADMPLPRAVAGFVLASIMIVVAGALLPFIAREIAQVMDWQESFVGTVFVALATTLPEMAVTVSALRLGALDMAIGNLFGSVLFNVLVLAVDDALYLKGPLLAHASPLHAVTAVSAMIMIGAAIVGLLYRAETRLLKTIGWVSLSLVVIYVMNFFMLLYAGHG